MQATATLIPIVSSFAITFMVMPLFIGYFRMKKEGQVIREEGPKWHEKKSGTPTMGGLVFLIASVISTIWVAIWQHQLTPHVLITLFILVLYGALGFMDDSIKLFEKRNLGLRAWQKLLGQIVGGLIFTWVYVATGLPLSLNLPGLGEVPLGFLYAVFILIWLVGFSNAVNLTDGLDGLVAGTATIAFVTYAIIAQHEGRTDILIFCLTIIGGLIAFFYFNHKPAKIFMGDVGSLALGGALAAVSILLHREFSLLLIGLVFVIETASVMIQVAVFHLTGKRVFRMSPIHHHFEMLGWSEWRVVLTFWGFGLLCAVVYLALFL
ncbi:phospho-N-acetylmuramoyl-pentapeptide-transferase [Loigolactobacillus bifermentans]|uniref:Phospho-N-acetylmuramoyl-pentapeptide-transferase n=1 Tax=Loigolactobacillus bifermentans DSM 20003 TaxID=1423726 RepID=A0A0R1H1W1_9LACO|nr:phospho-N-acetylmuramoyl-pentapeptide-transferase [Loigolactobacillus bifermentans]KRK40462.1 phospho-N-acetylmuramoyl-pentapeptide-transferase [Loigolactobacillus bifermentans DSM 20003]QGG59815.1 phospho-N-acetylmuramoyl-pentapeptide-transferase [Loigolactobacillus bifermentans]